MSVEAEPQGGLHRVVLHIFGMNIQARFNHGGDLYLHPRKSVDILFAELNNVANILTWSVSIDQVATRFQLFKDSVHHI